MHAERKAERSDARAARAARAAQERGVGEDFRSALLLAQSAAVVMASGLLSHAVRDRIGRVGEPGDVSVSARAARSASVKNGASRQAASAKMRSSGLAMSATPLLDALCDVLSGARGRRGAIANVLRA
jgi:hypothetical protein